MAPVGYRGHDLEQVARLVVRQRESGYNRGACPMRPSAPSSKVSSPTEPPTWAQPPPGGRLVIDPPCKRVGDECGALQMACPERDNVRNTASAMTERPNSRVNIVTPEVLGPNGDRFPRSSSESTGLEIVPAWGWVETVGTESQCREGDSNPQGPKPAGF